LLFLKNSSFRSFGDLQNPCYSGSPNLYRFNRNDSFEYRRYRSYFRVNYYSNVNYFSRTIDKAWRLNDEYDVANEYKLVCMRLRAPSQPNSLTLKVNLKQKIYSMYFLILDSDYSARISRI
jgi:hypothetical protein